MNNANAYKTRLTLKLYDEYGEVLTVLNTNVSDLTLDEMVEVYKQHLYVMGFNKEQIDKRLKEVNTENHTV